MQLGGLWAHGPCARTPADRRARPPEDKVPDGSLGPAVPGGQLRQEEASRVRTSEEEPQERTRTRRRLGRPPCRCPSPPTGAARGGPTRGCGTAAGPGHQQTARSGGGRSNPVRTGSEGPRPTGRLGAGSALRVAPPCGRLCARSPRRAVLGPSTAGAATLPPPPGSPQDAPRLPASRPGQTPGAGRGGATLPPVPAAGALGRPGGPGGDSRQQLLLHVLGQKPQPKAGEGDLAGVPPLLAALLQRFLVICFRRSKRMGCWL